MTPDTISRRVSGSLVAKTAIEGQTTVEIPNDTTARAWINCEHYLQEILRTVEASISPRDRLVLGGLGISGEAGEVSDHIKKVVYLGHPLDEDHLLEELGDVLWYVGLICNTMGFSLEEVIVRNIEKQRRRYPDGFSSERSINRKRFE